MSDIVERLHTVAVDAYMTPEQWAVVEEAKAEIERLRAIVGRLPKYEDNGQPIVGRAWVNVPHVAEVARLGIPHYSTREAAEAAARDSA